MHYRTKAVFIAVCGTAAEKRDLHWRDVSLCGNIIQSGCYKNSMCVCVGAHWVCQAHVRVRVWPIVPTVMHISWLTVYELKFICFTEIINTSWRHGKVKVQLGNFWYSHSKDVRVHVEPCRICSSRKNRWWLINVNFVGPRSGVDPVQCHAIIKPFWIAVPDSTKVCNSYGQWKSVLSATCQGDLGRGFRHCNLAPCEIAVYLDCLTLEDGIGRLSRNVSNKLSIRAV
jgi:hypothetical protein